MINFTRNHNGESWTLVALYGPCQGVQRDNFVNWLYNLQISSMSNWLLVGDFNFIRSSDNRNRPGGDVNDMFLFNDVIGHLGLVGLPLKGRAYTWSNMQEDPLLEKLDWFFTSANWTSVYPNTLVLPNHLQTIFPVLSTLAQLFPKPIFLGLKASGLISLVSWM